MAELNTPPPTSPPSSSAPDSRSSPRSLAASIVIALPACLVVHEIGRPLVLLLPGLLDLAVKMKIWQPLTAALAALGFIVAPVPTVELVKSLIGRVLPGKKE